MSSGLILVAVLIGVSLALRRACVKMVDRSQRLVVERFGRFLRCAGPGHQILLPFIDSGRLIELNEVVRGWQGMTDQEIQKRLLETVYGAART